MVGVSELKTLEGAPNEVERLILKHNKQMTLKGCPLIKKQVVILDLPKITSFEEINTAEEMEIVRLAKLENLSFLKGFPKRITKKLFLFKLLNIKGLEGVECVVSGPVICEKCHYKIAEQIETWEQL